jgi:hypothetical protein
MPTNNFGDNWLTKEERAYRGVNEHGETRTEETTRQERDTKSLVAGGVVFVLWVFATVLVNEVAAEILPPDAVVIAGFIWLATSPVLCALLHEGMNRYLGGARVFFFSFESEGKK